MKNKDLNKHFSKEDTQVANRHLERCSKLLIISGRQIKTTRRYHLTAVRMGIIKKSTYNKCWRRRRMEIGASVMENNIKVLQRKKNKNRTTTWFSNSTPEYISKNIKALIWKDTWTPMFIAAFFIAVKTWKLPNCPWDERVKKWTMEYYVTMKRMKFCYLHQCRWTYNVLC